MNAALEQQDKLFPLIKLAKKLKDRGAGALRGLLNKGFH